MAELRGQPLLINFWATWCPPCIKELPEFDRFARSHAKQLRVVGLAIDSLAPVQEFLKKQPVGFAIGLAGFAGTDLARSLGNSARRAALHRAAGCQGRGAAAQARRNPAGRAGSLGQAALSLRHFAAKVPASAR